MEAVYGLQALNVTPKLDAETEARLVEKCRRQSYEAFSQLVDAYESRVLGFVIRLVRNREEALDITQEVFIRAYQAFNRFDGRSSLRTWLFRIAHNLCVDRARREDRNPVRASLDANSANTGETWDVADTRNTADQEVLDEELHTMVRNGLARMSDKLRTVIVLHDQEEMSYEEIASTVGIPVGTVKSRLFLARNFLQQYLKEYLEGATR
ncbi:MAG: sigma-70 family RNA polymerase sigma factor [Chthonomonas sp.]|nr:sigma-70 family RNA polymerase sigma factor [Chthonomonas sp.]